MRAWVRDQTADILVAAGHPEPERTAEMLLMLRTGAVFGHAMDETFDAEIFLELWARLVGVSPPRPSS